VTVSKDLVGASAVPLVLSILRREPSYGYAIAREVRERSNGVLEWSEGMLYPVLHRMEREGWIAASVEKVEGGRPRRYYRLTRSGLKELDRQRRQWTDVHAVLVACWGE
jgi:PadR family transcriptional regulator PadR